MSFGYSIGDAVLLTQLAWKTVQNARKACGEHNELTQEVLSLHVVLRRLEHEVEKSETAFNGVRDGEPDKEELQVIVNGCQRVLNILDQVLTKYNALGEPERSGRKLWQKIKFGNGKMADMAGMRAKLTYYTSAMSLFLNMVSMGTMGRVERQINDTDGDLKEIKVAVNGITAHLMSSSNRHEGSILTAYADDDRAVWKEFRRELLGDGFSSSVIRKHKRLIKAYIEELGSRGLFDGEALNMDAEEHSCDVASPVEGDTADNPETDSILETTSEIVSEVESGVESPVESTPQPEFDIEPNTASHSETDLPDRERPINDTIPEIDSQLNSKPEMRWTRLRKGSDRETQNNSAGRKHNPTEADKPERDEETRQLHDTWHEIYDDIVPRFLEWCLLPFDEKLESDLTTLIDRVFELSAHIKNFPLPEHLSPSKEDLLLTTHSLGGIMKSHSKHSPWGKRVNEFLGGLGYEMDLSLPYIDLDDNFRCQLDDTGVCGWRERRGLREDAHARLGDAVQMHKTRNRRRGLSRWKEWVLFYRLFIRARTMMD